MVENKGDRSQPMISVVMAVLNGGDFLEGAIRSILNQTYRNFEFIIIDDGSTDDTNLVLNAFAKVDERIRVYSQENQGLSRSLNRGLLLAKGAFIARQDHDDISLPERFEKQIAYFDSHPECALLGTAAKVLSSSGSFDREHKHPCNSNVLKFKLIFNNPFVHTSLMFRSSLVKDVGLYSTDPAREPPEDYEFISRVAKKFVIANLPEQLVIYREVMGSISSQIRPNAKDISKGNDFRERLALISAENIADLNQLNFPTKACHDFGALIHGCMDLNRGSLNYSSIKSLINNAKKVCKIGGSSNGEYIAEMKIFQEKYLSFRELSFWQMLIFFSSGLMEAKLTIYKIFSKLNSTKSGR